MLLTKQKHRHIHTWFLFCLSACVCVRSLFETPFPLNDSLPNCPNYCTSCGFILKRADMFLTKLYTDLLPNVSDTNPLPSFDTHIGSCWCTTHLIHRYRKALFTACSSLVMTWFESSFSKEICFNICLINLSCTGTLLMQHLRRQLQAADRSQGEKTLPAEQV